MNHLSWDDAWRIVDSDENDEVIALLQHATTCSSCAKLLEDVRSMDRSLQTALSEPLKGLQPQNEDALWAGIASRIEGMNPFSEEREETGEQTLREVHQSRPMGTPTSAGTTTRRIRSRSRHLGVLAAGISAALVIGGVMMRSMSVGPALNKVSNAPPRLLSSENATATTNAPAAGLGTHGKASSMRSPSAQGPSTKATAGNTGTTKGIMQSAVAPSSKTASATSSSGTTSLMGPLAHLNREFTGVFRVRVVDNRTNQPVSGAKVFVVTSSGVSAIATTAQTGTTSKFDVAAPIDEWTSRPRDALTFPRDWPNLPPHGELTVIATKAGYRPTIMYHIPVGSGMTPSVVDVRLLPGKVPGAPSTVRKQRFVQQSYPLKPESVSSLMRLATKVSGQQSLAKTPTPKSPANGASKSKEPLTIRVLDSNGKPVVGASVMVSVDGQLQAEAVSGTRGIALVNTSQSLDWGLPRQVEQSVKLGRVAVLVEKPGVGAWWNFDVGIAKDTAGTLNVTLTNVNSGRGSSTPPSAVGEALLRFMSQHGR